MTTTIATFGDLRGYVLEHGSPPDEVARELADETRRTLGRRAGMQIPPVQAAFMTLLVRLVGARKAVEVGTFTGYSAIAIARGLAPGGRLLCCDVSAEWTATARRYWERAGVADRIELRLAPAIETLRALPDTADIDFAFIDADKTGYLGYWEEIVPRVRPGGLIVADNVLRDGRVIAARPDDHDTVAICAFNDRVRDDERVDVVMLPFADGVTLARKR
jgi:caffeoyl-CoA O-methyltransferase